MRAVLACGLAALPACGLGLADDSSGGRVDLPRTGAGPFARLTPDGTTPADEPWLLVDPILEVTEPALAPRPGGGWRVWVTRESAELPAGDTAIWSAELAALGDAPTFAPALAPSLPWEGDRVGAPAVIALPDRLVMYYAAAGGIGRATSTDGTIWQKDAAPVLTDAASPGAAFDGREWLVAFTRPGDPGAGIHLARSSDGTTFTVDDEPVLTPRGGDAFDALEAIAPALGWIVEGTGRGHWALWYAGLELRPAEGDAPQYAVGYAASWDGVRWDRLAGERAIVSAPAGAPAVVVDGNHGVMAYDAPSGRRFGVGLAATP